MHLGEVFTDYIGLKRDLFRDMLDIPEYSLESPQDECCKEREYNDRDSRHEKENIHL
jgi:hypothetical protein